MRRPGLLVAGLWLGVYVAHAPLMALTTSQTVADRLMDMPERAMWSVAAVVLWAEAMKGERLK